MYISRGPCLPNQVFRLHCYAASLPSGPTLTTVTRLVSYIFCKRCMFSTMIVTKVSRVTTPPSLDWS